MSSEQLEPMIKMLLKQVSESIKDTGLPLIRDERTGYPIWVDQRELRLRYFFPTKRIDAFFEGLVKGEVRATKCARCGASYFPPQADCSSCKGSEMEWFKIDGSGTLLTYTRIDVKPVSFSHYPEYVVGVARMKEGFNVLSWVRESNPERLRVGMPVKLTVEKREPEGYYTYVLIPGE